MELTKASIAEVKNESKFVQFQFNPATISFSKAARFRQKPTQSASKAPPIQFQGTGPTELKLEMIIDDVESGGEKVPTRVKRLLSWTEPSKDSKGTSSPNPPMLRFKWGNLRLGSSEDFTGILKNVDVKFEMFDHTGRPTRATVGVHLSTADEEQKGTNPTSGGLVAQRTHIVRAGDSLASVAFEVYGRANLWRQVADANRIDDPAAVRPGTVLRLPLISHGGGVR